MAYTKGARATRNSTSQSSDEESWTCKLCTVVFKDKKAELVECEYCEDRYCRACLSLSSGDYKVIGKRSDLHWYCPPCQEKVAKNIRIEKEIEERCRDHLALFEDRIKKLEEAMELKPNTEEVQSMIDSSLGACKTEGPNNESETEKLKQATDALDEFKESIARRSNVIVFHVEESKGGEPEERKQADLEFIEELCKTIETTSSTIKNITRLGKRNEGENEKPRPIKLVFEDEKAKGHFMGSLKKLEKAEEKFKKVSVVHDLTQKERMKNKELWETCKEKNKEIESGDSSFKYVLKGPPWDRRVAKTKK